MAKWKTMWIVPAVLALAVAAAGCSGGDSSPAADPGGTGLEPVTLEIVVPGNKGANFDEVLAEVNKRLKTEMNTQVKFTMLDFADLNQKTNVMLASGENVDLVFDAPWLHLDAMASQGYYEDLSELIGQYGPNVQKTRPDQMWDANKINGKIYGVPLGSAYTQQRSVFIRKDLREQLKLAPVKTYADLKNYLYAVRDGGSGITPLLAGADDVTYSWVNWLIRDDTSVNIRPTNFSGASLMLYYKGNDGKVYNFFETEEPAILSAIADTRKLFEDKVMSQDVLTNKSGPAEMQLQNKVAATPQMAFAVPDSFNDQLKQVASGGELEPVRLFDLTPGSNISNFKMDNFICIVKTSKHKDRAMMFLDWANRQENYDLLEHGIEGVNWKASGEHKYETLNNDSGIVSFQLIQNPVLEREWAGSDEETLKYNQFITQDDNFTKDVMTGFTFDPTPVKNEVAQFSTIQAKYYNGLFNGALDPDDYLTRFKAEGADILKKIQTEFQRQVDEFLAKKA
ncbi:extracellular solute-binding protein [Saccharibacillus sp. CPCC 101409]|uniref:extracellular solute-binding protein n=1 Tax=Saccharibacillus sp. CPCC 101409 TaxID=3058041 RepID=UPI0026721BEA|nr:extracellular solute-binding protein [Saccharibacillus sp. CPCC 101409]MDO3411796.1 extracellular solute-binding protein [Saccharibacillus sp. CPCC 101409]